MVKALVKKGAWSEDEDRKLRAYIVRYGHWNWRLLPKFAGLSRSGKSCRLRWMNYLRPDVKRGNFTEEDDHNIISLHKTLGNKWTAIAAYLPGRSDNEIKNRWNSHLKKRAPDDHAVLENDQQETSKSDEDEAPSSSSGTESSSWRLNGSDYAISSDVTPHPYNYELSGDFWTEPFLPDIMTSSVENTLSCFDDITSMGDDFSLSTLVSYFEYNNYGSTMSDSYVGIIPDDNVLI